MKKTLLTIAILLGMTLGASAQGGLFGRGAVSDEDYYGAYNYQDRDNVGLFLPSTHGGINDEQAPLGGGALLLIGLGAAYATGRNVKTQKIVIK